ncbi:MAG: bifunctional methylenetetrahydrofolate dehydrogenase/methenyltetrahydrofolate cyclohydrolase FolD [Pseudomonadota bacterium]|nr:bifunctional methylenetetrahydrofolate dehydrogenase/methenyltetrahydrofolate cyclohydrolase FolD [Pseudomonadota bacterium]
MTAKTIDGKAAAAELRKRVAKQVSELRANYDVQPGLAAILVGDDPASQVYIRNKERQTEEVGMASLGRRLPAETSEGALLSIIEELNHDPTVHGILVQLPLPKQIKSEAVISAISAEKDVDGFHPMNVAALSNGKDGLVPCTPMGCTMLLKDQIGDLTGKEALIIGRSNIVGKPMAQLLLAENCTVTIAHSRTRDLDQKCRNADIVVAAVGIPKLVKGDWIKPGATLIDVGINRVSKNDGTTTYRLVGDIDYEEAVQAAGAITPVPGGVGPMTIACLLQNTVAACKRQTILRD